MFKFVDARLSRSKPRVLLIPPDVRGYALVELCFVVKIYTILTVHGKLLTYPLTFSVLYETLRMFPSV